ncbi:penicillin-binding protein PBP2X [Streptococcus suis]|uniref:penicillin-binding protein PBP2X n=1 Tax=Streptococcus suis TaxID=1307 RepID=UPI000CF4C769|nr:penicillin-binding protein PBP2X [Streptococcus suis]
MQTRRKKLLRYILKQRYRPSQNRRRVGQNLILLSIFTFLVFLINFAIIIGTDSKFGVDLSVAASRVHQQEVTVQARRGTIYDRLGFPIAEDSTTYTVYAVVDKNYVSASNEILYVESSQFSKVASIFKNLLDIDEEYALKQLKQPELSHIYFGAKGKNISYNTMMTISQEMEAAGIKGIKFNMSPGRMYPNGNFASIFLGLATPDENEDGSYSLSGKTGMEYYLNSILAGQDGKIIYEKDNKGRILPGTEDIRVRPVDGQDVYTTLSADLQRSLETNMDIFFDKTKGKYASATLVSAKTGEILATTQRPSYDADTKEGLADKDLLQYSLLYQATMEPGSTIKVMTLASAIDSNVFDPNQMLVNNGYTIADTTVNDWTVNGGESAVSLNMAQAFALSSNVGTIMLEQKMGNEKWLDYLAKFRFGYPTRFGMGSESAGLLPGDNIVTITMSSFGQGISATQVQMLRAFSAIGNDGTMLQPKFISGLYDPNSDSVRIAKPEVVGHPVSEKAASDTRDYMITVGTDPVFGTLYNKWTMSPVIQVNGYDVAVKSGTAQIAKEDGTGYIDGRYLQSVVAMVPAEDPEFIMYATVREPESYTGMEWEDIFNPILKEAMLLKDNLNLDNVAPSLQFVENETEFKLPDVIGQGPGTTAEELRRYLIQPVIVGNGSEIKKVSVDVGTNLSSNQQILLLTDSVEDMPDLYGLTKENMDILAEWLGLEVTYEGAGSMVVEQSIEFGTKISKHKKITITLGE